MCHQAKSYLNFPNFVDHRGCVLRSYQFIGIEPFFFLSEIVLTIAIAF